MTRSKTVIDDLREFILENIDDPKDRSSNAWVNTTSVELSAEMPRIHIHKISSPLEPLTIGKTEMLQRQRIQVSIFVSVGEKLDFDDDGEDERPEDILDWFVDWVVTNVNDNQQRWRDLGDGSVQSLLSIETNTVPTQKDNIKRADVDFRLRNEV